MDLFKTLGEALKPEIIKPVNITNEQINDLMVAALEGGINYWCGRVTLKEGSLTPEQKEKMEYISDAISLGGVLIIEDVETDETWELTKDKFLTGVEKTIEWGEFKNVEEMFDNHDAETADVLLQYAIFGEIVFG